MNTQKNIFDDSYQIGKGKEMVKQQKNCSFSYHQIIRHFRKLVMLSENISSILGDILITKKQWHSFTTSQILAFLKPGLDISRLLIPQRDTSNSVMNRVITFTWLSPLKTGRMGLRCFNSTNCQTVPQPLTQSAAAFKGSEFINFEQSISISSTRFRNRVSIQYEQLSWQRSN